MSLELKKLRHLLPMSAGPPEVKLSGGFLIGTKMAKRSDEK